MKRLIFLIAMLSTLVSGFAASPVVIPTPTNATLARQGDLLEVKFTLPLKELDVKSNRETVIIPSVIAPENATDLPTIAIFGRKRNIYRERGNDAVEADFMWAASKAPKSYDYSTTILWEDWMEDGLTLRLTRIDYGCCSNIDGEGRLDNVASLELPKPFVPTFNFVTPTATDEVKSRSVNGRAFIDFPSGRTEINPDYRSNAVELAKIRATIDSVATDKDITVKSISIKGFASPEGSYASNARLAEGRTIALKDYVKRLYNFPASLFSTSYVAEDWEGLIDWLRSATIENRDALLAIATDESLDPDIRDRRMRNRYPHEYSWILANVYPALRHSDYAIDFEIRSFTDIDEIRSLVATAPQKLSLNEFFLAARNVPEGSDEYNTIYATAARMYPASEIANLNAALASMQRGDLSAAADYLSKAGDTPEAIYAAGTLNALRGDNVEALRLMQQAARLKVADAPAAIQQLNDIIRLSGGAGE